MSKNTIKGKAFVLGKNVDTDQIIPAQHLVYSLDDPEERKNYGKFALSGVPDEESGLPKGNIPLVKEGKYESEYSIIIGGPNFGCGSSREHAPAALQIAGIKAIVAPSYARIFYRNSVDGGFVIPYESTEDLSREIHTGDDLLINRDTHQIENQTQKQSYTIRGLGDVAEIIEAGGIFDYARTAGMV
jgi:3-isopropylmalate/(R)-2-methylmalate dehydratase small subunit